MNRYTLSPEAAEDLREIRAYLRSEAGPSVAKSTLAKIRAAFAFLSQTPGAGHSREDLTLQAVKFWPVFSYLVIYRSTQPPIEIVRVLHGRREVDAILSNEN